MWYKVDINKLSLLLLPTFLRRPVLSALLQIYLKPVADLHYTWSNYRNENLYKIEHNWQVCYMQKALNDRFDPVERRIYIGDGLLNERLHLFTEAEQQTVFIDPSPLYIWTENETADTGLDFIVFVPTELYNTQIHSVYSHVNYYKIGGVRYTIMPITN